MPLTASIHFLLPPCYNSFVPLPLLSTKFYVPPAGSALVARPRLVESFSRGLDRPLILVSAPPGFGKTTLVASWIAGQRARSAEEQNLPPTVPGSPAGASTRRFCWLSLDPADNDPTRFWIYVVAALTKNASPAASSRGERTLGEPAPSPGRLGSILDVLQSNPLPAREPFLATLINALEGLDTLLVLVLDDYHLIQAPAIHQGMSYLVEHLPPQVHLVILTRVDPPLPLHRLRARGQLHELRPDDLRFTPQEAADFLQRLTGLGLPGEDMAVLEESTEGWAAGLQMAALALQAQLAAASARPAAAGGDPVHQFIAGFSGKHHYILDYLAEEVFNRQPAPIQAFLLQTSILERMCAPLCAAVTGQEEPGSRSSDAIAGTTLVGSAPNLGEGPDDSTSAAPDAQTILEYLERANLFLVPLDGERQWYRYHHLFADLLRARLRQRLAIAGLRQALPGRIAALHARASAWYEANGWSGEAIDHALAGEDWERAARLMERNIQEFVTRGRLDQVIRWIEALPPRVAKGQPRLCAELAWALTFASQVQKAAPYLQDAEAALAVPLTRDVTASTAPLPPWPKPPARSRDVTPLSRDVTAASAGAPLDPAEVSLIRAFIAVMRAFGDIMSGERAGALAQAQAALAVLSPGPSRERAFLNWVAGFASRSLGNMELADQYLSEAALISLERCNFLEIMVMLSEYGITCWLMGKLSRAVEIFRQALQVGAESGVPNHGYLSRVESYYSVVLLEQNEIEQALKHARTSVEYASWWPSANHTTTAYTYLGRALQAAGDLEGAAEAFPKAEEEAHYGPVLEGVRAELEIRQVRLWLAQGYNPGAPGQERLVEAIRWADAFRHSPGASYDLRQPPPDPQLSRLVTLAWVRMAQHRHAPQGDETALAEALELLEGLAQTARSAGRNHALIEILVLLSAACFCQAQLPTSRAESAAAMERALMALDAALQLGQPEGYVRVFVDGGQPVETLLRQSRLRSEGGAYLDQLLAAFPLAGPAHPGGGPAISYVLAEPLTERELEVLRLLALGLSNSEIAGKLFVSEGTVKTHVHNLIGKLNARGRSHAVALARELNLI